jgi:hypothetical protein
MHKEPARTYCDVLEDRRQPRVAFYEQPKAWISADEQAVDRLENWE